MARLGRTTGGDTRWLGLAGAVFITAVSFCAGSLWEKAKAIRGGGSITAGEHGAERKPSVVPDDLDATQSPPPQPPPLPPSLAGEFEAQSAVILICDELAPCFPELFKALVTALHSHVRVICLHSIPDHRLLATSLLEQTSVPPEEVDFVMLPLNSMWVRDYGPFFLRGNDRSVFLTDLDYTPSIEESGVRWRDDKVPCLLGEAMGLSVVAVPLRLGGGNLISNGRGLCLTTSNVILDNADRGYDPHKIRSLLERYFGCRTWLCLEPLVGEPTGHVDTFVTFLAPDQAVVGKCDPQIDPTNADILDRAAEELRRQQTPDGPMRVSRIPFPPRLGGKWRSYTNVILANGVILVPTFSDVDPALQEEALGLYARLLPGWEVVGINADRLAESEGLLHCISLNVPAFALPTGTGFAVD